MAKRARCPKCQHDFDVSKPTSAGAEHATPQVDVRYNAGEKRRRGMTARGLALRVAVIAGVPLAALAICYLAAQSFRPARNDKKLVVAPSGERPPPPAKSAAR